MVVRDLGWWDGTEGNIWGDENALQVGYVAGYVNMSLKTHPTVHQKW